MAHYLSCGQLHLSDTRDQAAEHAVQDWARLTAEHGDIRAVALIVDASNHEIDRLNARAQHLRAERGELGRHEIPLPGVHYGLRQGDLIAFTTQHRPPRQPRIENDARGEIIGLHASGVAITLDGSHRQVQLDCGQLDKVRLAYAQHVYRQQGATVERSVVITGGWQTSKETAYVEATRARQTADRAQVVRGDRLVDATPEVLAEVAESAMLLSQGAHRAIEMKRATDETDEPAKSTGPAELPDELSSSVSQQ